MVGSHRKTWAELSQEQADKRAAKGKAPIEWKSFAQGRQEQADKRAAQGKVPTERKTFAQIRQEQADKRAAREGVAETEAASPIPEPVETEAASPIPEPVETEAASPIPEPVETEAASPIPEPVETGWWAGIQKSTVAVNVIYLGVKTLTKSMGMGTLKINPAEGITWRAILGPKITIPWATIETIDIDGESTSRVTLARAAAIGVFALGAKKKRTDTTLIITTPEREYGFEFENTQPTVVRNKMRPVLSALAAAATLALVAPEPARAVDIPEQIAQLANLRDRGILSGEEFETKKAELLARM